MATNITDNTATTIASQADAILIQANAALTGSITCVVGGVTFATITNPTVGSTFRYGGLHGQGAVVVTASGNCNITVTLLSRIR